MNFTLTLVAFSFSFFIFLAQPVFAEGGGGIECPETAGLFSYVSGSAIYQVNPFDQGEIGVLYCEYETEAENFEEPFGEVTAIFHVTGELSQDLIDEYGCGAILGEQYSSTYISSKTHFASVAFSINEISGVAANIMLQIENNDLATSCIINQEKSTVSVVKEAIEKHEIIKEKSEEISTEQVTEIVPPLPEMVNQTPASKIVLPNWIKMNAGWWAAEQITDDDFSKGIEFMINHGYIKIPVTEYTENPQNVIPSWVKNNADWWSQEQISDEDFVTGLQFLISNGIIIA